MPWDRVLVTLRLKSIMPTSCMGGTELPKRAQLGVRCRCAHACPEPSGRTDCYQDTHVLPSARAPSSLVAVVMQLQSAICVLRTQSWLYSLYAIENMVSNFYSVKDIERGYKNENKVTQSFIFLNDTVSRTLLQSWVNCRHLEDSTIETRKWRPGVVTIFLKRFRFSLGKVCRLESIDWSQFSTDCISV